jgi:hypothetical protein
MPEIPPAYVLRYRNRVTGNEWEGTGRPWADTLAVIRMRRRWGHSPPIGVRRVA